MGTDSTGSSGYMTSKNQISVTAVSNEKKKFLSDLS
jgi:hypothetical protein